MKILMSRSKQLGKAASTGFRMVSYKSLEDLAIAMHHYSHSPSIYSKLIRYDTYSERFVEQQRRRLSNISFTGNVLVFDIDDGGLSFKEACALNIPEPYLVIRSKNDHKYPHDRFKILVVTDLLYPSYHSDAVPEGYSKQHPSEYVDNYFGYAKYYGFEIFIDRSTKDLSRLVAEVSNKSDFKDGKLITQREFYASKD